MRRMIVATLVLIPVLAHAQASTSTEAKPSQASATLMARATAPAAPKAKAIATAPQASVHETVSERVDPYFNVPALREGGSITYTLIGEEKNVVVAPKLIHVVGTELPAQELAAASNVSVHLTVDQQGVPQKIKIAGATDAVINEKTLEAVSQYRFAPATVDNLTVPADVTLEIKIQK